MAMCALSCCLTISILNLHYYTGRKPLPQKMHLVFFKYLAKMLFVDVSATQKTIVFPTPNHLIYDHHLTLPSGTKSPVKNSSEISNADLFNSLNNILKEVEFIKLNYNKQENEDINDWRMMAKILDRLFFVILFFVSAVGSLVVLTNRDPNY